MKKWFLKPEWTKADEEGQSVVFDEPEHDPDDFPPPPPLEDEDQGLDDDDGSFDTPPPDPQDYPVDMEGEGNTDGVEGEGLHQEPVSPEARKRFSELFEQEAKPRKVLQVGLVSVRCIGVWCCAVVYGEALWCVLWNVICGVVLW